MFEIAFSQQFQRANSLAGSIFGEIFVKKSSDLCGHPISGQTLVSGSLFAYAICSDGLGTKARVHQWTWLDSANHVVVHQDRSTYYSALGSDELLFPADTLVAVSIPVGNVNNWVRIGTGAYPGGNVEWTDKHQAWSGDFLPSRSQVQYLATQPLIDTDSALKFDASTAGSVRVTNRFKEAVGPLIFRSSTGSYFHIDKINAGDTQPMQASNQQAVVLLLDDHVLPPAGFVPSLSSRGRYGSPSDKFPLLEHRLNDWRGQLPKNTFCGLKEIEPRRIAMENTEIKSGLQIVLGQTP